MTDAQQRSSRPRRRRSAVGILVLLLGLIALPVAPAAADDVSWNPNPIDVEFGQYWSSTGQIATTGDCLDASCPDSVTYSYTGPLTGTFTGDVVYGWVYVDATLGGTHLGALPAGEYTITGSFVDPLASPTPPPVALDPVTVTVEPAAMSTDVRVQSDPAAPDSALVSVLLRGGYLTRLDINGVILPIPAGTWTITATADDGTVALQQEIPARAGGASAVDTYWRTPDPGTTFRVTGTFTPDDAADFAIEPGAASFTTADAPPVPTPTSTPAPAPAPIDGVVVPVWGLLLAALVALAAAAVIVVTLVRRRGGVPPAQNGAADGSPAPETETTGVPDA